MTIIHVNPTNISDKTLGLKAGETVRLKEGRYTKPLTIEGAIGTATNPIRLEGKGVGKSGDSRAVITSDIDIATAQQNANQIAFEREASGYYPSVGQLGDQAMLVLRRCQYVIISSLAFEDCWPTAIYIDECQHIVIDGIEFTGGTLAVGANGMTTHDIFVEGCSWQQDVTGNAIWNEIAWNRIHGAKNNSNVSGVDLEKDHRHFDGDFFRAWDISGNVVIRNNHISDAFNGIHFFNRVDRLDHGITGDDLIFNGHRRSSVNVLIENNTFVRVRDNVFEPENFAWNWVIRHNKLFDCYRPFSFELERAGYIYIYGNRGQFGEPPSKLVSTEDEALFGSNLLRKSMSLFKPKGTQANDGPIYVTFNTWNYTDKCKGLLPKFALGQLIHTNNIIQLERERKLFGNGSGSGSFAPDSVDIEAREEERRFTRRWHTYKIFMDADVSNDRLFPNGYKALGYPIGDSAFNATIKFMNEDDADPKVPFLKPDGTDVSERSFPINMSLPNGGTIDIAGSQDLGAVQSNGSLYGQLDNAFTFLPTYEWATKDDENAEAMS